MKTYGPANDKNVPQDEINLAKLVQNAKGNSMGWCKDALYKTKHSKETTVQNATKCCAIGARMLTNDLNTININMYGNDTGEYYKNYPVGEKLGSSFLLGLGYRLAMR